MESDIDRVTLANELMKQGQLQSVDGLSYLVSLDDGLPQLITSTVMLPSFAKRLCFVGSLLYRKTQSIAA